MSDIFNRQQVDDITAPWLSLCKEQEERIAELKKGYGLLEISRDHERTLRTSCEQALLERDAKLERLEIENKRQRDALQEIAESGHLGNRWAQRKAEATLEGSSDD